uniref:Glycosyl transferase, group 1 family protein n=1 Tax=Rubrivivax gelatinosus S1 TaxID=1138313 RepID=L8B9X1_RUBGE|nr:Glycosyl transferase, group 1 family protein [Rubrivivax gelatinosus S1]
MRTVYLNGKFLAQRTTGVQRFAARVVIALDRQLAADGRRWVLLCPPQGEAPALAHIELRRVAGPVRSLHAWEQLALPRAARGGLLVNLAGSAPWFAPRQVATLHDAAVFDHPEAYAPAFVAWYRRLFRRLGRRAERLLTVSAFSRQRLVQALGVAPERFAIVPCGADHLDGVVADDAVISRLGLEGRRFVLAVGSENPTKNQAGLLAAWRRLQPGSDFRLVLVGGRNQRVFQDGGAGDDPPGVLRTGWLPDAPLVALYRRAEALAFPSHYEGFGLPPVEAMSCGCPVLAARAASLPEVCGDAALYVDPADPADIAAGLQRLIGDEALRSRLRAAGRERVASCTWAASATALRRAVEAVA